MANARLVDMLLRFDAQTQAMHEGALQWLREAATTREQELAKRLLRHAKGARVAAAEGRQALQD